MVRAWASLLQSFPDTACATRILNALRHGADLGYLGPRPLQRPPTVPNLPIPHEAIPFLRDKIQSEVNAGRTLLLPSPPPSDVVLSPIGVVPKAGTNSWRVIHHLSWPRRSRDPRVRSVNSWIEAADIKYTTIDRVVDAILRLGRGALLTKFDVQHAFRLVPVKKDDCCLLGFTFEGKTYVELTLPFGLRSSPALWHDFSTALEWILRKVASSGFLDHYVDDFIKGTAPGRRPLAIAEIEAIARVLAILGVPESVSKRLGPALIMAFLGIEIDTEGLVLRVPSDKLCLIVALLRDWENRRSGPVRDFASLIGKLAAAARVIRPGRTFTRRLLDTLRDAKRSGATTVQLDASAMKDIRWWLSFAKDWNGVGCMFSVNWSGGPTIYCDASKVGVGGWFPVERRWLVAPRPESILGWEALGSQQALRSTLVELYGCLVVLTTWAPFLRARAVTVRCDNTGACAVAHTGTSSSPAVMDVWRSILALCARSDFCVRLLHIAGSDNASADALSRQDLVRFRQLQPDALPSQDAVPMVSLTEW